MSRKFKEKSLLKGLRYASGKPINKIKIKPHEQPHISLGSFTNENTPKGFAIELSPNPNPVESIVTQVISRGIGKRYELILHIANYGNKSVNALVRQL